MKHFIIPTIIVLMAILVFNAAALQIGTVKLGDDKQDRNKNVSATFTITNDHAFNLTNIRFATTATSDKNINFSAPANLTAGASASVTISGKIPLNLDGVNSKLEEAAVVIGTMTATADGNGTTVTSSAANIEMQANNQLIINDLTFFINGDSESTADGDKIDNIKPGDKLRLEIEVKNKFSDSDNEDIDVEDVEVSILVDDNDFDVDEDDEVGDLGPKDEDEVSFDFDVDDDVDDGTYKLVIKVSGKDENGALHGEENTIRLQIERETHDITIRRAELSPSTLVCGERNFRVTTTVSNLGRRDEDAVAVEVVSPQLKVNKKVGDIELDEDRSRTESFDFSVPEDTKSGSYRVDVSTFFDNIAKSRSKSLFLTVEACEKKETKEEPRNTTTVIQTPPPQVTVIPPAPTPRAVPKTEPKESFMDSTSYVVLLAGISGLVFVIIVVLLVVFLVRRNK